MALLFVGAVAPDGQAGPVGERRARYGRGGSRWRLRRAYGKENGVMVAVEFSRDARNVTAFEVEPG